VVVVEGEQVELAVGGHQPHRHAVRDALARAILVLLAHRSVRDVAARVHDLALERDGLLLGLHLLLLVRDRVRRDQHERGDRREDEHALHGIPPESWQWSSPRLAPVRAPGVAGPPRTPRRTHTTAARRYGGA